MLVNNAAAAMYAPLRRFSAEAPAPDLRGQRARAARPRAGRRCPRWSSAARAGSSTSRPATARPHRELDDGRVRRVEGGAEPPDPRARGRARRHRRPGQHGRTARGGHERGRDRAHRRHVPRRTRSNRWRRWSRRSSPSPTAPPSSPRATASASTSSTSCGLTVHALDGTPLIPVSN